MGGLVVLLLAERARSEGARPTRAFEDRPGRPVMRNTDEIGEIVWGEASFDGRSRKLLTPLLVLQVNWEKVRVDARSGRLSSPPS